MSAVRRPTHDPTVVEVPEKTPDRPRHPCECDIIPVSPETEVVARLLGIPLECGVHPGKSVESDGEFRAIDGSWRAWLCRECLQRRSNYVRIS